MASYSKAEDVRAIAENGVIPEWHKHLQNISITYLFDSDDMVKAGRPLMAKVKSAGPIEEYLSGSEFIVIVNKNIWEELTKDQRIALVDHELCHIQMVVNKSGDISFKIVPHDLEEFNDVVRRHGAWQEDIVKFNEAQQELFAEAKNG